MLASSLAIAWPLWRRHRLGLIAVVAFFAVAVGGALLLSAILNLTTIPNAAENFRNGSESVLGPIAFVLAGVSFLYLIGVFSYGFDADIGTAESCFPAGQFRLPLGTLPLVGWPMVYGAGVAALMWVVIARLII